MNKLALVCIAALLFMAYAMISSSSFAQQQQGETQVGSDGGLIVTLNGDSFTTGDTIIVNGTVGERDSESYVSIEVYDPQRRTVERELVPVTADNNAFTYSFVAGELAEFDPDFWMQNSGTYRMVVRYTPPDLTLDREVVEFAFEYTATTSNMTSGGATTTEEVTTSVNNITTSSAGATNETAINQSTAQAIRYTELAYLAVQNNDSGDILANLSLALDELDSIQGNLASLTTSTDNGGSSSESGNITARTIDATDDNTTTVVVSIVPGPSSLTDALFQPNPVQVSIGDTVKWINHDSIPHTVTSSQNVTADEQFDSGILAPNSPFEHTFTEAGEYRYSCVLHPNHGGTVIVI